MTGIKQNQSDVIFLTPLWTICQLYRKAEDTTICQLYRQSEVMAICQLYRQSEDTTICQLYLQSQDTSICQLYRQSQDTIQNNYNGSRLSGKNYQTVYTWAYE